MIDNISLLIRWLLHALIGTSRVYVIVISDIANVLSGIDAALTGHRSDAEVIDVSVYHQLNRRHLSTVMTSLRVKQLIAIRLGIVVVTIGCLTEQELILHVRHILLRVMSQVEVIVNIGRLLLEVRVVALETHARRCGTPALVGVASLLRELSQI